MAPVGSYESLRAAIAAGADSVYFGVGELNMRSRSAANFTLDDIARIVSIAREAEVKTYLTLNTVIYDNELTVMRAIADRAAAEGVDAVIASDQAAIAHCRSLGIGVHISTQLNISNLETVRFYSAFADVMVLARELSLEQTEAIHRGVVTENICGPRGELIKIELFVHGALCMSVSGKCYLSLHECGESANRGACRQICRRSYLLTDKETGYGINTEGEYLLSPKDLCTIDFLDNVIGAGVSVLKIEGRARSAEYVKRVVECYSQALEAIFEGCYDEALRKELKNSLGEVFNRGFWEGYYLGRPAVELSMNYGSSASNRKVYVGKLTNFYGNISVAEVAVEATPLDKGDEIVVIGETTGVVEFTPEDIFVDEVPAETAPQGRRCSIKSPSKLHRGDKLYKLVDLFE